MLRRAAIATVLGHAACGPAPGTAVLDPAAWTLDPQADPLPEHRQTEAPCLALEQELGGIEVQTNDCPYGVLTQPVLVDLRRGQSVSVLAWHNDLVAPEPGTGHMFVTLGTQILVDWEPEIPSNANVLDETIVLLDNVAAGERAVLHLHNHGANTWNLNAVEVAQ